VALKRYATAYIAYLGTLSLLLLWALATTAWLNGDWRVTLYFNAIGEGMLEVIILSLLITCLPLVWVGLHEALFE
jgi:hypothetical protein